MTIYHILEDTGVSDGISTRDTLHLIRSGHQMSLSCLDVGRYKHQEKIYKLVQKRNLTLIEVQILHINILYYQLHTKISKT